MSPGPHQSAAALDFSVVTLEEVSRSFGRRRALSRVSARAAQGEILGVLGPNGAGKSTLIGILATLLRPTAGRVRYGDAAADAGAPLRARIGVLGHDLFLYPELTARENLEFFAGLHAVDDPAAAASDSRGDALAASPRAARGIELAVDLLEVGHQPPPP